MQCPHRGGDAVAVIHWRGAHLTSTHRTGAHCGHTPGDVATREVHDVSASRSSGRLISYGRREGRGSPRVHPAIVKVPPDATMEDDGAAYFDAYADMDVHALMLRDQPRNRAYREALRGVVAGCTVLDAGAGTGLLSLFAAAAGARHVYAVEASSLADTLPAVFAANGFADTVTVLHGRLEEVQLPEKVDVLMSEWMGFHLLHESMLDSVLHARDAWLKPDGVMLPSHAQVMAAPVNMDGWAAEKFDFWAKVEGEFDMSALVPLVAQQALAQPEVTCICADQMMATPEVVATLDLHTTTVGELSELGQRCRFRAARSGIVHGYALWFACRFQPTAVVLSTGPSDPPTHWKQSVVLLPEVRATDVPRTVARLAL